MPVYGLEERNIETIAVTVPGMRFALPGRENYTPRLVDAAAEISRSPGNDSTPLR